MDLHFAMFTSEGIFCTSNSKYQINLIKTALRRDHDILQIIGIIVGLLKDRVTVCDEPESKRRRVQEKKLKNR